jgi:5-methylcytosine-specific restriction endonuclease McrA
MPQTPEDKRAKNHAYYAAHKHEMAARKHAYRLTHYAAAVAKDRAYDAAHRAERAAKSRAYRVAHHEEVTAKNRAYRAARRAQLAAKSRAYHAAHPDISVMSSARRRATRRGVPLNDLSHAQWLEIQAAQDYRCYYCGKRCKGKLTQDHITPLSKGGSHTLHNVIGACRNCNAKKHTGAPLKPVQPLLLTMGSRKKSRAS